MQEAKEFQIEYSIFLPVSINGNFSIKGNPFDREDILANIAKDATNRLEEGIDWSQCLGVKYTVSESARLLDSAWNSYHSGKATAEDMLEVVKQKNLGVTPSKVQQMRKMHSEDNG